MSGKKGKGSVEAGIIKEGTAVRVLYDDEGWFHGDVKQILDESDGKSTRCLVQFEDGETAEASFPSNDAQVCEVYLPV